MLRAIFDNSLHITRMEIIITAHIKDSIFLCLVWKLAILVAYLSNTKPFASQRYLKFNSIWAVCHTATLRHNI